MSQAPAEYDRVMARYINAAEAYESAIKIGDYKTANASHDIIQETFEKLKELGRGHEVLALLADKRLVVRYCAAVDALSIASERGEQVLDAIINGPPSPIRLMAQVSLDQWRKRSSKGQRG